MRYAVLALLAGCAFDGAGLPDGEDDGIGGGAPDAAGQTASTDAGVTSAPDAGGMAAPPDAPVACGPGYDRDLVTGSGYRVVMGAKTWDEAEADCEANGAGAHLAIIDDAVELGIIDVLTSAQDVWIGVSDRRAEGTWRTVTGEDGPFLAWEPGEPNNWDGDEDCGELYGSLMNDDDCDDQNAYVCECDARTVDHGAF